MAGILSLIVVVALAASRPRTVDSGNRSPDQPPSQETAPAQRGESGLAARLAEQAQQLPAGDRQGRLRLLLAAHVLAPDSVAFRINLAHALLVAVRPTSVIEVGLVAGGPVRYAALSSDGSFLVTSSGSAGRLWQTGWLSGPPLVRLAKRLESPVDAAAGAGRLTRTNLLLAGPGGVFAWRANTPIHTAPLGRVADRAEALAISPDANTAVIVQSMTATLWDLSGPSLQARATLSYGRPVTALAFSPGAGLVLVAGHADGGITVHTIDLERARTTERTLTGPGGPIATVALSADAGTVAALHQDGTLSVWDLHSPAAEPAGSIAAAAAAGPYRVWVSPTGDYAFVADAAGPPTLWSLAHPARPVRMLTLAVGTDPAVPAMISADGRTVVTINRAATLTIWDAGSIVDALASPADRACPLAEMTEQQWRQMVPDPTVANPCATPGLPTLGVDHT